MSIIVSISEKSENNAHKNGKQSEYGVWDYYDSSKIFGLPTALYTCSECLGIIEIIPREDLLTSERSTLKYCPCCGIKMKKSEVLLNEINWYYKTH